MRFPIKIDFEVLKPFFRVLYMKFLTESENGMNEETQQGLKSLFRAPLKIDRSFATIHKISR